MPDKNPHKISAILVAWNSGAHLAESLPALQSVDESIAREAIVVNNSPEDITDICNQHNARLLTPGTNLGFGRGVNYGLRETQGDVILVLNPDAVPSEGALIAALDYLDTHPDAGIVCPKLVYPDGVRQDSARCFYSWKAALYARSPFRDDKNPPDYFRRYMMLDEDFMQTRDIDWALGAAMLIRRELIEKMGGRIFDPRYFLYFEDVDLCYTCWRMGYRVVYLPGSVFVHHYERKSKKSPFSIANWHHMSSFMKYVFKHRGLPSRPGRMR